MTLPRVVSVSVDSDACLAHELCVAACPQVFSLSEGLVTLNPGFQQYLQAYSEQLLTAELLCPTRAIVVETDPSRPLPPAPPLDLSLKGKSVSELLRAARGLPTTRLWWAFWRR